VSIISRVFAVSFLAISIATPALAQQTVVVGGIVVSAGADQSLPYSTVSVAGGVQRFTGADGSFSFALAPGQYSLRVRQLGFAPLDTTITVASGANLRALLFRLQPVAIRLDAIRTYATSCSSGFGGDLGVLVGELSKNADREKLLRTEYPFVYEIERKNSYQGIGGTTVQSVDTVKYLSKVIEGYAPGHLVRLVDSTAPNSAREMRIPTLTDLADPLFIGSHCFKVPGMETVDGARAYRIDFQPSGDIKATDVEGTAFIDSTSYLIRKAIFRLTKPEKLKPPVLGLEVTTTYREIFNGLTLFEKIHSEQVLNKNVRFKANQDQDQRLTAIKFYGRTPDDIVIADSPKPVRPAIDSTARISGTVTDSTGRRLRGAEIRVADGSVRTTTSDSGQFLMKGLKPGKTEFLVRALGFGAATFTTELRAGRTRQMRVILRPSTVQLSTITVLDSLSAPLLAETGFFDRKRVGWGSFITPEDVERRHPMYVSDMLRSVSGVEVTSRVPGRTTVLSTRSMSMSGRCVMNVFVDGTRAYLSGGMTLEDVVSGSEMGAMEVYPSASETPPQFIVMGSDCGTLVIWTKGWLSAESQPDSVKHD
jgi:hypothetical protein